jgi:hypothetical protein
MSALLLVTALLEVLTGLALLATPSLVVSLLLGTVLDSSSGMVLARVAGAALLSIGIVSWLARNDRRSPATGGLVWALLLYNAAVAAILIHGHSALGLSGIALWPAVIVHIAMAGWCILGIRGHAA